MSYNSVLYLLLFLPCTLLFYQMTPQKWRWVTLLTASYLLFWSFSGKLLIYLIGMTLLTYTAGIALHKVSGKLRKTVMLICVILLVAGLAYLKYYNFFVSNFNLISEETGSIVRLQLHKLVAPIGISFYTLQAIGYIIDVYWKNITVERHFGRLALFLGFFPQLMEGPIARYSDVAEELQRNEDIKGENVAYGAVRIFWGLFKKMVIADRLAIPVNAIFDSYQDYSGVVIALAAIGYTIQLYMEFSGCMDIVIGSGRMFGVRLPENFRQPFASKNASEFWRRWHITLGVWFKTYIFFPASTSHVVKKWSKYSRKKYGKYVSNIGTLAMTLFPVWLCNGIWHGAAWNYIFYGMYYFVLILAGEAVAPIKKQVVNRLNIDESRRYWQTLQIGKTWLIIFTGELFFRANGLSAGFSMISSMITGFTISGLSEDLGAIPFVDAADILIVIIGCIIVAIVGSIREKRGAVVASIDNLKLPVRWCIYYALIFSVVIFGAYGAGYQKIDLIYAGF
ncbi:MAG: MBOAT family O-acyltransferase [Bacillota bacterium]|nr:MBOAT family O-acyltransferase [Bacillota bacterium]